MAHVCSLLLLIEFTYCPIPEGLRVVMNDTVETVSSIKVLSLTTPGIL